MTAPLGTSQQRVLDLIVSQPGLTMYALDKMLGCGIGNTQRIVRILEDRKFITTRLTTKGGRRRLCYPVTP